MTYDIAGAWTLGADYINTKVDNAAGNTANEENAYRIGASRNLGPGVTWDVQYNYYDHDVKGSTANDQDASLIATTITLSF
jgi:predicted porin